MFSKFSRAGVGMYATFVVSAFQALGLEVTQTGAENLVISVLTIASIAMWAWGQLDRNDLEMGIKRKQ